jgi:nitrite reductase (NADH) small subunit
MGEHRVGQLDDFSSARGVVVEVAGREIGVFRVGEQVYALRNACPHQGGPVGCGGLFPAIRGTVSEGRLREYHDEQTVVVACPWHGWEFDVRSGICLADPARRVASYPVLVRDGEVTVVLPDAT